MSENPPPTAPLPRVRVPASTSNLGPGFDLLGLALSLWLEVRVVELDATSGHRTVERAGTAEEWPHAAAEDLVVRALSLVLPAGPGACLAASSEIPVARGLGSSGAAVAAGLLLGAALAPEPPSLEELHAIGVHLEGHPDNVTASLLGGLTLCHPTAGPGGGPVTVRGTVSERIGVALAWPDATLPTALARAALPEDVSFNDAVENPRRLALLLAGLRDGDPTLVALGLHERLHERYRLPLVPGGAAAIAAAREAGAWGACISGSGTAVVALGERGTLEPVAAAMAEGFRAAGARAEARTCEIVTAAPVVTRKG